MPYRVTLPFEMSDDVSCSKAGRLLCANFYAWVEAADVAVCQALHQRPGAKPFTLSPLTRARNKKRSLHVSLLDDDLWPILLAGLRARPSLTFHGRDFQLAPEGLRMTYASYGQLWRDTSRGTYVDLRFVTPACFRAGDLDYPLPEPRALYKSWLSRWNQYAPQSLQIAEEIAETAWGHVGVAGHRIWTETVDLGYGKQVGFLGKLSLCLVNADALSSETCGHLHALADYAEFCGTGRKTTHGMGQTRRIHRRA